ncbi:hypothetical protein [Sanyastnella coralliicola]|uniref:hypothetical protein n=1 Tax=Sanyastnella coralliicola TaxID=3069118 RepID=UPI0027BAD8E5|nr:hypothetical protein [Longitalea sp. SCSIO 12813]
MNYKLEPYPSNIHSLLTEAQSMSKEILKSLNFHDCPRIDDLYKKDNKGRIRRQVKMFEKLGIEPNSYLTKKDLSKGKVNELKGLYVMGEFEDDKVKPIYIGISRTIFRRLKQHAWGKNHNECTLAYLMTEHWDGGDQKVTRASVTDDMMEKAKKKIRTFNITFVPVENDYDLYFLEVALAGIFKTHWNSFKTH